MSNNDDQDDDGTNNISDINNTSIVESISSAILNQPKLEKSVESPKESGQKRSRDNEIKRRDGIDCRLGSTTLTSIGDPVDVSSVGGKNDVFDNRIDCHTDTGIDRNREHNVNRSRGHNIDSSRGHSIDRSRGHSINGSRESAPFRGRDDNYFSPNRDDTPFQYRDTNNRPQGDMDINARYPYNHNTNYHDENRVHSQYRLRDERNGCWIHNNDGSHGG